MLQGSPAFVKFPPVHFAEWDIGLLPGASIKEQKAHNGECTTFILKKGRAAS